MIYAIIVLQVISVLFGFINFLLNFNNYGNKVNAIKVRNIFDTINDYRFLIDAISLILLGVYLSQLLEAI